MLIKVHMQRPSPWSKPESIYDLFRQMAKKGHTYTCRDITGWMQEVDGLEHSPSMVCARMLQYLTEEKPGIAMSVDAKTGKFVGWRKTA